MNKAFMTKLLSCFLAVLVLTSAIGLYAVSAGGAEGAVYSFGLYGTDKFVFKINEDNTEATVCGYIGEKKVLTLPDEYMGLPVTGVGTCRYSASFRYLTDITEVIIPDSVKSISGYAFNGSTALEKINIPDSVDSIGKVAFENTKYYNTEANWDGDVLYIDNALIKANTTLKGDYSVKEGTTVIADEAIKLCTMLETVTMPDSVIGIGEQAFQCCEALKEIALSKNITKIKNYAFIDCISLKSVTIPDKVTSMGVSVFSGCTSLEEVNLNKGLSTLESYAFQGCTSLKSIVIPEGVETIGDSAFRDCTSLENITLPDSLVLLRGHETVLSKGDAFTNTAYYNNESNWENDVLYIGNVLYQAKTTVGGEYTVKDGTKIIAPNAFEGCSDLEKVVLPDTLITIGAYAFNVCPSLDNVVIPDKVSNIDMGAFTGNESLKSIVIPNSVISLGHSAFRACSSLESVILSENITEIYYSTFADCIALKSIEIPASVKKLESGAFRNSELLEEVVFKGEEPEYNQYTFEGTPFGAKLNIDNTDDPIRYSDTELEKVRPETSGKLVVKNGTTEIGGSAFYNCTQIESVVLPYGVKCIKDYAFNNCTALTSVVIPESLISYSSEIIFNNCNNLVIYGVSGSAAEIYAEVAGLKFEPLAVVKDDSTNISVAGKDIDAKLNVKNIVDAEKTEGVNLILTDEKALKLYDITLTKDGKEIQPEDSVTVKIPCSVKDAKIYRVEADGTLTDMKAVYANGFLGFNTEHFSLYVVAVDKNMPETESDTTPIETTAPTEPTVTDPEETVIPENPSTTDPEESTSTEPEKTDATENSSSVTEENTTASVEKSEFVLGDVNMDSKLNIRDATAIQKHLAKLISLDDEALKLADFAQDGKISIKDATAIQKFIAGIL